MKRNINLQELSRDHHHGLLLGWKIRQGLKYLVNPDIIAEYVIYFSEAALFPHFKEEETHLLDHLPGNDSFKKRTLQDHEDIANLISDLSAKPVQVEVLLKVAKQVDDHIRFEERELFPYLEQTLDPEHLVKIGVAINVTHQPYIESYPYEFWKKAN